MNSWDRQTARVPSEQEGLTMRVIFRVSDKQVVAVLPEVDACPDNLVCYAHVGQHSECSRARAPQPRKNTRPC